MNSTSIVCIALNVVDHVVYRESMCVRVHVCEGMNIHVCVCVHVRICVSALQSSLV